MQLSGARGLFAAPAHPLQPHRPRCSTTATACPATHPAAAAMRPQLGSWPKMADLAREEPTTDLATRLAAASSAAPSTSHSISTVAPSPSQAIDLARPCEKGAF